MGKFNLSISDEISDDWLMWGDITINDFSESFEASPSYWFKGDYYRHWFKAIKRLFSGQNKTFVITSMYQLEIANFIWLWTLYREGNIVYIQNMMFFINEEMVIRYKNEPIEDALIDFIEPLEFVNEDGYKISTWETDIKSIEQFLKELEEQGYGCV